jgi:prepilin-type N-terminal cleavage/methylation domain-containing protein
MEVKRIMMPYRGNRQHGFTVIEVMLATVIASVLVTAVYQTFHSQQRSYLMQSGTAAMQQNLRGGMYLMNRELRSAGYNPMKTMTNYVSFVTGFPAPNNQFAINYATDHSIVAFTLDTNGNGVIDPSSNEQIAYRFNTATKTLERFNATQANPANKWEVVATNIDAVYFAYFDQNNTLTTNPANIRQIEVSLLARMEKKDDKYTNTTVYKNKHGDNLCPSITCPNGYFGDHYHRSLLTTTIQLRNRG